MQDNGKKVIVGGLKGGIFCFVVGTVFVLLTALAAKWFNLSDTALNITAQVLRVAAVVVGVLFVAAGVGMVYNEFNKKKCRHLDEVNKHKIP